MGDWWAAAACKGMDPDLFHPERGANRQVREAKAVCHTCPVREQCLEWALAHDERIGVWGGMSERQRRRIRTKDGHTRRAVQATCVECGFVFAAGSAAAKRCGTCRVRSQKRTPPKFVPHERACSECDDLFVAKQPRSSRCVPCREQRRRERNAAYKRAKRRRDVA